MIRAAATRPPRVDQPRPSTLCSTLCSTGADVEVRFGFVESAARCADAHINTTPAATLHSQAARARRWKNRATSFPSVGYSGPVTVSSLITQDIGRGALRLEPFWEVDPGTGLLWPDRPAPGLVDSVYGLVEKSGVTSFPGWYRVDSSAVENRSKATGPEPDRNDGLDRSLSESWVRDACA